MAWNTVKALAKAGAECVKLGTFKMDGGFAKTTLTISDDLLGKLGHPKRANVFKGDGEEADSILVQFDKDGAHELGLLSRGGGAALHAAAPRRAHRAHTAAALHLRAGRGGRGRPAAHHHAALVSA